MQHWMRAGVIVVSCVLLLCGAVMGQSEAPQAYSLQGDFWFAHDPSIAKYGPTYYVFATGKAPGGGQLPVRCSEDLVRARVRRDPSMDPAAQFRNEGAVGTGYLAYAW